jgi:DNA (cytosine-5)-methyltransferase 1
MKLGSLFDGSGGFPLAGLINGIEPVWASEIEKYPVAVTTARFPQMKHLGSVLDVNGAEIEPVDIITFGSPCQDLSVAGKQAGLHKGERSNLFFEAIRIIKEMREATNGIFPRIAVWENVPGAYSSNKGEDFRAVLQAFCSVKEETADVPRSAAGKWNPAGAIMGNGWSIAWRTFDAQYWGVPQRRKRIYLIADFGSERAGEILFEQEGLRGHSAQGGKAREGTADDAQGSAGRSCNCLTPDDVQSRRVYTEDGTWPSLYGGEGGGHGYVLRQGASDNAERGVGGGCEPVGFQSSQSGFRLCATHATLDANNGSRRQNGVCYPAGDATGGVDGGVGVECVAAGFCQGASPAAQTIGYQAEIAPTLKGAPSGTAQVPAVVVVQDGSETARTLAARYDSSPCADRGQNVVCYPIDSHQQDSRFKICEDGVCPTAPGQMGTGGNNWPMVLETFQNTGCGWWNKSDISQTVRTPCGGDSTKANLVITKTPRKYIIRRLTPLECCRLQGFPDWWEDGVQGSDSARYKMWGNGIALPNAAYVIGCAKKLIQGGHHRQDPEQGGEGGAICTKAKRAIMTMMHVSDWRTPSSCRRWTITGRPYES